MITYMFLSESMNLSQILITVLGEVMTLITAIIIGINKIVSVIKERKTEEQIKLEEVLEQRNASIQDLLIVLDPEAPEPAKSLAIRRIKEREKL